jgi:hypothetical protein
MAFIFFYLFAHANFGGVFMKKAKSNKDDKIVTPQGTTGSYGISGSANLTAASSGTVGDGSNSLFPKFHEEKGWSSKTSRTMDLDANNDPKGIL